MFLKLFKLKHNRDIKTQPKTSWLTSGNTSASLEHHHGLGTSYNAIHQLPAHLGR